MTYKEYCESENGQSLYKMFRDYQNMAICKDGMWWVTNALIYCVMMELWSFLEDEDNEVEMDEKVRAGDYFDGFLKWAKCSDVAIVLCLDHGDERAEVLRRAITWRA
jgi:hypothetical protein